MSETKHHLVEKVGMKEIPLTQGKVTLVDDADYEWLSRFKWKLLIPNKRNHNLYAYRQVCKNGKVSNIWMHREILGTPEGFDTDHINHDGLDNRRANLRIATIPQNHWNQRHIKKTNSGFKGVHWSKTNKQWIARICLNGKRLFLGGFRDRIEAAKAYNEAAIKFCGGFARLNEIPEN